MKFDNFKRNWIVVLRPLLTLVFVVVVICAPFALWAWWNFGSFQTGWAYISGYSVVPVTESIEFDSVPAGGRNR